MLYHSGARNYGCELCGNKFFQMEHLKRHMQSIHNFISSSIQSAPSNLSSKLEKPKKIRRKIIEEKPDTFTIDLIQQPEQANDVPKCIYRRQKCDFSALKISNLNEHIVSKHPYSNDKINFNQIINQQVSYNSLGL